MATQVRLSGNPGYLCAGFLFYFKKKRGTLPKEGTTFFIFVSAYDLDNVSAALMMRSAISCGWESIEA